ncbi:MarR family transcriptional regulator [Moritella sp.]|uniref:MarR family winged helix-turn-helix transcriptional regulator n=1 Tax=Moritella sp. TaxID=78556 RepID=UPI001D3B5162|nr:MarR family transcriptional regulator [Moritella sp.]MCJ8351568.1 MarR family transcriptional regulator [Moritella sp.]NQZ38529.1 MarR family transcriptional regulator [Moritella sp.]
MTNNINEILQAMDDNWPECADGVSPALLRLLQVSNLFHHRMETLVASFDLQRAEFSVLSTLRRSPAPYCLSPTALYQSMIFSSGGLTKVLNRLSQAALIERIDNPEDKRSKLVLLTSKGKQLIETVMPKLHQQERKRLSVLSADELQQLDAMMQRMLAKNKPTN